MFNYSFKIFTRQNKTVTENNLVNDIKVTVHHLLEKCQNYASVCVAVGKSFAMSMVESLSVLSLCIFKTVRLLMTNVTTNASFCLFICAFVFASNSGHFRINDFLLFFTPLLLLNYFLFNLFLFLQKSGGAKAPPAPPSARSLYALNATTPCNRVKQIPSSFPGS